MAEKIKEEKIKRIQKILSLLRKHYGVKASLASNYEDAFESLISTMLSHRTHDEKTSLAADRLLAEYGTPEKLAVAPLARIRSLIKNVGFYNTKAKRIKQAARIIVEKYGGHVPRDFNKLLSIPGVGRKTAGCVFVYAFSEPAIPVDTHVAVISKRLGWTTHSDSEPEKIEEDLRTTIPKRQWIEVNELLVLHGQNICLKRKPLCWKCFIINYCPHPNKNLSELVSRRIRECY